LKTHPLFVTTPPGLESLLSEELRALGAGETRETYAGVHAIGDWRTACRIALWTRLANRVLLPLARFPIADAEALYEQARAIDWTAWFTVERSIAIEVAGRSSTVTHSHFAALRVKDAIADRFRAAGGKRPDVDTEHPDVTVHLHLDRDHAVLSLDLAGRSLHQRGYRGQAREAPLKENLAAGILLRADWPAIARTSAPLLDPMCGSGTLVIEAALMAADIAPGLLRARFGGAALACHDPAIWSELLTEARSRRDAGRERAPRLFGRDVDTAALAVARTNARRAGVDALIDWQACDVTAVRPPDDRCGLLVTNPPYGVRLGSEPELITLYSLFGNLLREHFGGWQAAVFTARADLTPRLGLRARKLYALKNGAIDCKLLLFAVPESPAVPATAGIDDASDFANRLRKNLQHLSRWARRQGVHCYRLYDADLPDYALAIDLYHCLGGGPDGDVHVVVQEYAAPKTVDPVRAEKRLRAALAATQAIAEVPSHQLHYRLRQAQKGRAQYQRQAEARTYHEVDEHGCRLLVNFDDYLDTGLFLDHRPLRRRIQRESRGKRFLNLFCYTASATVHAVRGGAAASVSVDLSPTYLEWARRNLELNDCAASIEAPGAAPQTAWRGPRTQLPRARTHRHRLLRADCLAWLEQQAALASPPQFDLILCDPPTFSNSKRTDNVLDVQRDHVALIRNCTRLLSVGGSLYFSTNRRRFKLDAEALADLDIVDITAQTLDEDFRRPPPPHRCWQIRLRPASSS
jgi:23S rRNA (guanine2445-N2)-methyltransferase / 23S rRNA (guanine2069-N7)-methyltransferase